MASCVRNIRTKNYYNQLIRFQVTVDNVEDPFLRHSVVHYYLFIICIISYYLILLASFICIMSCYKHCYDTKLPLCVLMCR